MAETPKKTVSVFFVVDGRKLEAQSVLLASSLQYYNGDAYKYIAYYPEGSYDQIARITKRILRACRVELRPFYVPHVGDRDVWRSPYPQGNKILAALQPRDTDISVFMDTDMVCAAPVDFTEMASATQIGAVVSDYSAPWASLEDCRRQYEMFGLKMPEERVRLRRGRRLFSPPYFNGGLVAFPEKDGHFSNHWLKIASQFDWEEAPENGRSNIDQITLPITIRKAGYSWRSLPGEYNFNVMHRKPEPGDAPQILHYHKFKFLWLWPGGEQALVHLEQIAGEALTNRMRRRFSDEYAFKWLNKTG